LDRRHCSNVSFSDSAFLYFVFIWYFILFGFKTLLKNFAIARCKFSCNKNTIQPLEERGWRISVCTTLMSKILVNLFLFMYTMNIYALVYFLTLSVLGNCQYKPKSYPPPPKKKKTTFGITETKVFFYNIKHRTITAFLKHFTVV
jgi:hypothetical protein